jgi:hypothetical protein
MRMSEASGQSLAVRLNALRLCGFAPLTLAPIRS